VIDSAQNLNECPRVLRVAEAIDGRGGPGTDSHESEATNSVRVAMQRS
jgi:hypothetical protein